MALNADMLKNPKVLAVVGVAVVGGIYLSSRIKGKSTANADSAPVEVQPTINATYSPVDSVQQNDALSRQLTDAQQKLADAQSKHDAQLAAMQSQSQSERDSFNNRLDTLGASLGTQYSTQIAGLQSTIEKLQAQINARGTTSAPAPATTPVFGYNPPTKSAPANTNTQPPITTMPVVVTYPGVPSNTDVTGGQLAYDFDALYMINSRNGMNSTFNNRNMMAYAIRGVNSPWIGKGDWRDKVSINRARIVHGLRPLTDGELNQLFNTIDSWSAQAMGNETTFLSHARELYNTYNKPYQILSSAVRK